MVVALAEALRLRQQYFFCRKLAGQVVAAVYMSGGVNVAAQTAPRVKVTLVGIALTMTLQEAAAAVQEALVKTHQVQNQAMVVLALSLT